MKNSLKNKFKNDYENLSENPSPDLWERIESGMSQNGNHSIKKDRKSFNYWKVAAVVLLMVSVGFSWQYFVQTKNDLPVNSIAKRDDNSSVKNSIKTNLSNERSADTLQITDENQLAKSAEIQKETSDSRVISPIQKPITQKEFNSDNSVAIKEKLDSFQSQKKDFADKMNQNKLPKVKTKYVTAEDLLFEREAGKSLREQEHDTKKLGNLELKLDKPKGVKILGITVYSEENE